MALRNWTANTNILNQENIKSKSMHNVVPEKIKRAALGEIGNKVNTVRNVEPFSKTNLLQIDKKQTVVRTKQTLKPANKVVEKPSVQTVIPVAKNATLEKKKTVEVPLQKEVESFSSGILAVEDIDREDHENPALVSIYINDIYKYLRTLESKYCVKKEYLMGQEVTPKMRSILIDWLIEVHQQFKLLQETLYLTVAIIDRFLQAFHSIDKKRLQLVGITAMFIASKYEEIFAPSSNDFEYIADFTYSTGEIYQMEILIMKTLDFSLGKPLSLHFLRRYSKAGKALALHHMMAKYFLEQCLVHYEMCHYSPSLLAAAAIYLALVIIGNNDENKDKIVWTNTLAHYTTYTRNDVLPVVWKIARIIINADKSKYQAVRKKFAQPKYMKASVRPELQSEIMISMATADRHTV